MLILLVFYLPTNDRFIVVKH